MWYGDISTIKKKLSESERNPLRRDRGEGGLEIIERDNELYCAFVK